MLLRVSAATDMSAVNSDLQIEYGSLYYSKLVEFESEIENQMKVELMKTIFHYANKNKFALAFLTHFVGCFCFFV